MTILLSEFIFDEEPNEVDAFDAVLTPVGPGSTTVVLLADGADTLGGADSIVAFGNYLIQEPPVTDNPIDLVPDVSTKAFGIFVSLELPKTEVPDTDSQGSQILTRGGDDVVIGAVQLLNPDNFADAVAFGYVANFQDGDLFTGTGDDLVAGLAGGVNATTVGIGTAEILTEEDDDIVVGAATTTDANALVYDLSSVGITASNINGGTGADIVAGAAVMIGTSGTQFSASGVVGSDVVFDTDDLGDIAIGIGIGIGDGWPVGTSSMEDQSGLAGGVLTFSNGDDVGVGVIALSDENDIDFTGNTGVAFNHQVSLGDGNNTLLGVAVAVAGGDGDLIQNTGIGGIVFAGDGNDLIIGATLGQVGNNADAFYNTGIGGPTGQSVDIFTAEGEDTVIGIFDVSAGGTESEYSNNFGIVAGLIDTGAQNDIVIGLSMPLSGGSVGDGLFFNNYGISGTDNLEPPELGINLEAFDPTSSDIQLGGGDDFVFARGLDGGILNVNIEGGTGNDVFDIQNGYGRIDGGDDIDTLILQGDGYTVNPVGHDLDEPLAEVAPSVYITREDTNLLVENVEFVVIDGETFAIETLLV